MGDAAHAILIRDSATCTGNFFIDDDGLADSGVVDRERYSVNPGEELMPDFFI